MFDLRKIFDLCEEFCVPKDFLKSKNYCTGNVKSKQIFPCKGGEYWVKFCQR